MIKLESGGEALNVKGKALIRNPEAYFERNKGHIGYEACMEAAHYGIDVNPVASFAEAPLRPPPTVVDEQKDAQAFALRCVGIMATATHISGSSERFFAKQMRDLLASNHLEQPFKSELARVWNRPALQNALRTRRIFALDDTELASLGEKLMSKMTDNIDKKGAADRAKHGLRWCALPSCAKQEKNVFDFKECSACKAVVYCSAEHGALHWTATHKKECASLKAAGAKPRSTADAGVGGAGAA